jgi:hypothetical protein
MKENGDGWSKSHDSEYRKRSREAKAATIPGHRTHHTTEIPNDARLRLDAHAVIGLA